MKKSILLPLVAVAVLTSGAAHAGSKFGVQQSWKQRQMLNEEFRRAREVGGYNDPVTAMRNILSGQATEKDIRSGVNHITDTPGIGTIRLKGRWD